MTRNRIWWMAFALLSLGLTNPASVWAGASERTPPPNIILILCDNLGYGDVGCFGSTKHRTPHLDRMAAEGIRLTSFYSSAPVCTPSRASFLTGCYPRRVNMHVDHTGGPVLRAVSARGLNPDEMTLGKLLKERGYATACIGKWHLGDQPPFLPRRYGFDEFFGLPYSEDMVEAPATATRPARPPLPLLENETVIEAPPDRNLLTKRFTERALDFITRNKDRPFFLYLPHTMPGSTTQPFASEAFRGKSANGPYGDAIEELDWSAGEVLKTLQALNIDKRTLVMWTSDNGAVLHKNAPALGSNKPLRGWGYTTEEGGMRMPFIARWPDRIPAGVKCDELTTAMDLLPTLLQLAGGTVPKEPPSDGKDIWPLLSGKEGARSPHEAFFYYYLAQLQAVRSGRWKLYLPLENKQVNFLGASVKSPAKLVDLDADLAEENNLAERHPEVVKRLLQYVEQAREELGDLGREGKGQRPAGHFANPRPLIKGK